MNGQAYRCLVIPFAAYRRAKTLEAVCELVAAGVPVFAIDGLPTVVTNDATMSSVAKDLLGFEIVSLTSLADTLRERGLYEVRPSEAQPWLRTYVYDRENEHFLFLVNEHPKLAVSTTLRGVDGAPVVGSMYDLLNDGAARPFAGKVELAPYESALVALGVPASADTEMPLADGEPVAVSGPWRLSFATAADYPAFCEQRDFADLSDTRTDATYLDRCGTFRYEGELAIARDADGVLLDLGEAYEMVDVWLDGEHAGSRIAPPYVLELGALSAGTHALAIEVTNTLDKDIHDMFSMTETAEPSGLIGPVAVTLV